MAVSGELLEFFRSQASEVPPRSIYQLLDRDKPSQADQVQSVAPEQWPLSVGTLYLYGKQTDRAAHVDAMNVQSSRLEQVKAELTKLLPGSTWVETPGPGLPLSAVMLPSPAILTDLRNRDEANIHREVIKAHGIQPMLQAPLPCLKSRSLDQVKDDPTTVLNRLALARVIEGSEAAWEVSPDYTKQLRERAVAYRPQKLIPSISCLNWAKSIRPTCRLSTRACWKLPT